MKRAPLRVLMTADTIGGVWTYVMELARSLAADEVEIALATMGAPASPAQRSEAAALPHVRLYENAFALEWMDEPWREVDAAGDWLLGLASDFEPDLIHLNGYAHAALPWSAPVLVVAHSCVCSWWRAVKSEDAPPRYDSYRQRVELGLQSADLVVAPSAAMLHALRENYTFTAPAQVIPNGRDPALFAPAQKQPVIFSAGRLWDEAKGAALLERIAPELRWPVKFAGGNAAWLNASEMAAQLAHASIYAAPARYEPFGLGILEAALSGCALVLSDLPSLRENWTGAALFVPPGDAARWRAALQMLIADEPMRSRLAIRASERARQFTPAAMRAKYLSVYRDIIAATRPQLSTAA